MFNNNHIAIHEVRYANSQQDSLIVLFSDQREEKPQVQEMEVEVRKGDAYYEAVRKKGWTKKKIVDATALYKLNSVRAIDQLVNAKFSIRQQELDEREEQLKRMFEGANAQWKKIDLHKEELKIQTKKKWEAIDQKVAQKYIDIEKIKQQKYKEIESYGRKREEDFKKRKANLSTDLNNRYDKINAEWDKIKKKDLEINQKNDTVQSALSLLQEEEKNQREKQAELIRAESIMEEEVKTKYERTFQTKIQEMIVDTFERNQDPDDIFKFKLALFDIETVAKAPRDFKLRLRKAKSIVQCYAIVNELYEFLENESTQ